MPIEEERLSITGTAQRWVIEEHRARYLFAAELVNDQHLVVDCACGSGIATREFLERGALRVIAVDASVEALMSARSSLVDQHAVHFIRSYAEELPIASKWADVVVSLETLEHLPDAERFLDEAQRLTKSTGVFVCSTPNRSVTHPGAPLSVRPMNRFHIREYSIEEFRQLLERRFQSVQMYGQNPQRRYQRELFGLLAHVLSFRMTARLNQALKLRRLLWYDRSISAVVPLRPHFDYEYIVAVCCKPI